VGVALVQSPFRRFARAVANAVGAPWAFLAAVGIIVVWGATGRLFGYSDRWQLFVNTGTTIVTFLMVFLIQNTQNRDARVTQLKLDELIRAVTTARTQLVAMEEMTDEELAKLEAEFHRLHTTASEVRRTRIERRTRPRDTPSVE
jgi:low affinity Fe/Cu permease